MKQFFSEKLELLYREFDWLALGLLAFILLIPKFPFISVRGTYVNVRVEDFVVAVVYGLWLWGWVNGRFSIKSVFNYKPILAFLVYGGMITLFGITLFGTVKEPHLGILHWLRRVEYLGMYFVAASTLKRKNLTRYLYALLGLGVVVWIYGFLQWKNILPGVHTLNKSGELGTFSKLGYVISTFAAHYDLGAFLILMIMLSIWGYFTHSQKKQKLLFVFLALAFWWLSLLVYGRAAYLGMLVGAIFVLGIKLSPWILLPVLEVFRTFDRYFGGHFSRYTYNFRFNVLPQAPVSRSVLKPSPTPTSALTHSQGKVGQVGGAAPTSLGAPHQYEQGQALQAKHPINQAESGLRIKSWLDKHVNSWSGQFNSLIGRLDIKLDPSASIRLQEWPDAIAKVGYHFLWGGGYYTAGLGTDSDYVRHLVEVGVIGLALFLLIIFDFIRLAWRNFRKQEDVYLKHFHLAMIGFVIGLLVEATFIDIFAASKIAFLFWFLMGLVTVCSEPVGIVAE